MRIIPLFHIQKQKVYIYNSTFQRNWWFIPFPPSRTIIFFLSCQSIKLLGSEFRLPSSRLQVAFILIIWMIEDIESKLLLRHFVRLTLISPWRRISSNFQETNHFIYEIRSNRDINWCLYKKSYQQWSDVLVKISSRPNLSRIINFLDIYSTDKSTIRTNNENANEII